MKRLHLTLACGDYEITRPLVEGVVQPEGIDLTVLTGQMPERNFRMSRFEEFDVCEYSLSGYVVGRSQGRAFTGIPVFLHRRFRHSYVFVNTSRIHRPADLAGGRVGLREWIATAGYLRAVPVDPFTESNATWVPVLRRADGDDRMGDEGSGGRPPGLRPFSQPPRAPL